MQGDATGIRERGAELSALEHLCERQEYVREILNKPKHKNIAVWPIDGSEV